MPTEEQTYRAGVLDKLDGLKLGQEAIDEKVDKLDKKVSYTNGKVRKTIIALVLIGGIVIGLVSKNLAEAVHLVTGIIH